MKEQNPLDNFLKQKLDQQEFLFRESYWEDAEQLIEADQAENKKRRGILWWLNHGLPLGLLLIFVTVATAWFWESEVQNLESETRSSKSEVQSLKAVVLKDESSNDSDVISSVIKRYSPNTKNIFQNPKVSQSGLAPSLKYPAHRGSQSPDKLIAKREARQENRSIRQAQKLKLKTEKRIAKTFLLNQIDDEIRYDLEAAYPPSIASLRKLNFPKHTRHTLSVMTGAALTQGLGLNGLAPQSKRAQPAFGLVYNCILNPHFRIQSGLNYAAKGNLTGALDFETLSYGFGSEKTLTTITPRTLHYVELPLAVVWRPFGRHYISAGVYGARLVEVSSHQLARKFDEVGAQLGQIESKEAGYRAGFQSWDAGFTLGYGYYLGKGFKMDVNVLSGLTDLSVNSFWKQSSIDRNLQLRLSLTYDIYHW